MSSSSQSARCRKASTTTVLIILDDTVLELGAHGCIGLSTLLVLPTRRTTLGDRSFPAAAA